MQDSKERVLNTYYFPFAFPPPKNFIIYVALKHKIKTQSTLRPLLPDTGFFDTSRRAVTSEAGTCIQNQTPPPPKKGGFVGMRSGETRKGKKAVRAISVHLGTGRSSVWVFEGGAREDMARHMTHPKQQQS